MQLRHVAVALFALVTLAGLAMAEALPGRGARVSAQEGELVIEILPGGFNPEECTLNRNSRLPVRFINRDTKPRRIVVDEIWSPEPGLFARDTGWLEPGEKHEPGWTFGEIQDLTYRDHDNPALTGKIKVPLSNTAATICAPEAGGERPAAPCSRFAANPGGCRFLPRVATDGPLE